MPIWIGDMKEALAPRRSSRGLKHQSLCSQCRVLRVHVIDSDGSLNEHNTSTHNPFGTGKLDFDKLAPALRAAGVPHDWWCVDLCFWPDAWDVTAQSKKYLDKLREKHAAV